jgi:hypothetical protein
MKEKETYRALKDEALPLPSSPCDLSARLRGQWPIWAGIGRVSEGGGWGAGGGGGGGGGPPGGGGGGRGERQQF